MKHTADPREQKIKALMIQIDSGHMKNFAVKILDFIITHGPSSQIDIKRNLGGNIKTIEARLSDLNNLGILEPSSVHQFESSSYTRYRYQPDQFAQIRNAYERKLEKFERWRKRGENEFADLVDLGQLQLKIF